MTFFILIKRFLMRRFFDETFFLIRRFFNYLTRSVPAAPRAKPRNSRRNSYQGQSAVEKKVPHVFLLRRRCTGRKKGAGVGGKRFLLPGVGQKNIIFIEWTPLETVSRDCVVKEFRSGSSAPPGCLESGKLQVSSAPATFSAIPQIQTSA